MTKSARLSRQQRRHPAPPPPPQRATYRLADMKQIKHFPYEDRETGELKFGRLKFPCAYVVVQNMTTGEHTRITFTWASERQYTIKFAAGMVRKMGHAAFENYAKDRFGLPELPQWLQEAASA